MILSDGEQGCNQVIDKDHTIDDPGGGIRGRTAEVEHLRCGNVAGGVDKHGSDEQQQQAAED